MPGLLKDRRTDDYTYNGSPFQLTGMLHRASGQHQLSDYDFYLNGRVDVSAEQNFDNKPDNPVKPITGKSIALHLYQQNFMHHMVQALLFTLRPLQMHPPRY